MITNEQLWNEIKYLDEDQRAKTDMGMRELAAMEYLKHGNVVSMPRRRRWDWAAALVWLATFTGSIVVLTAVVFGAILIGNGIGRVVQAIVEAIRLAIR